jgi:hypothetical protein
MFPSYTLQPGTEVEVRSTLDQRWARGFVVEQASEQGYLLRRRSDGRVLPTAFPPDAVRPASTATSSLR